MKVEKNKVVAVSYELEVEGQIADRSSADKPLEYIHGSGMLLPKFEANLEGKEPGDSFSFTLTPGEGYGEYDERYRIDVPLSAFEVNGEVRKDLLVPGRILPIWPARPSISAERWRACARPPRRSSRKGCTANTSPRRDATAAATATEAAVSTKANAAAATGTAIAAGKDTAAATATGRRNPDADGRRCVPPSSY